MTKKNFIALADYIKDARQYCPAFTDQQIGHLANFCHSQNPAFNRTRWLAYVNGTGGPNGGAK